MVAKTIVSGEVVHTTVAEQNKTTKRLSVSDQPVPIDQARLLPRLRVRKP